MCAHVQYGEGADPSGALGGLNWALSDWLVAPTSESAGGGGLRALGAFRSHMVTGYASIVTVHKADDDLAHFEIASLDYG